MNKRLGVWVGVPLILAGSAMTAPSRAAAGETSDPPAARFTYLLPEGFSGWACTDFGVVGAPPLPRQGHTLVIRPRPGEILKTAETAPRIPPGGEAWIEIDGKKHALPKDVYGRRNASRVDTKDPVARYCEFFGTEDEADAAGDAPGIGGPPDIALGVSTEEREALVALYEATEGSHWTHRVGWLGPPGTECRWHGVSCWSTVDGHPVVTQLNLSENNLAGSLPDSLGRLIHLEWLHLHGNRLNGRLPDALTRRWLAGSLMFSGDASLLTDVSEISFDSTSASMLCAHRQVTLRPDGSARLLTQRCRNATRGDRRTFCEMQEGRLGPQEFARLAVLIERNGFFGLPGEYSRNITDSGFDTTRVVRGGKPYRVSNYAAAGPFELWVIQTAIEGVSASAEWDKTTTQSECPWAKDLDLPMHD